MTESESVALPFGDSPTASAIIYKAGIFVNQFFCDKTCAFPFPDHISLHPATARISSFSVIRYFQNIEFHDGRKNESDDKCDNKRPLKNMTNKKA